MNVISWLFDATFTIGDQVVLWREVVGNAFGLASALGGMRRRVWAWPVGIVGNVLLFTVFLGAVFDTPNATNLLGQAGRQVMFVVVSVYGWATWRAARRGAAAQGTAAQGATSRTAPDDDAVGATSDGQIVPRWASARQRWFLLAAAVGGTAVLTPLFRALGSYEPVWADAWIFVGSLLATYGMARGWVEFWLVWVAVDLVGVPLLFSAGYWASASMYVFYGAFTLTGFFVWWRASRPDVTVAQA